eukprot:276108_1
MGICCSSYEFNTTSRMIDTKMKQIEHAEKKYCKLLFLGPGGGGKSTIFKQLQWLHGGGFTDMALQSFKNHIHMQITTQMKYAIKHYLSEPTDDTQLQNEIDLVRQCDIANPRDPSFKSFNILGKSISYIWSNDARLKDIFDQYDEKIIMWPSTEYFWDALPRVSTPEYTPTNVDIIKVRNMSTGVVQKRFSIEGCNFHIFDVGGQKSERKKWITCFDNASVVVFVASLSCYNEAMFEDKGTNCTVDALELFDQTINNSQFKEKPIILFLNKTDLFRRKLKQIPITVCPALQDFDENVAYVERRPNTDDEDYLFHQCSTFIKMKFEEKNRSTKRSVFTHVTCAMDEENIKIVFADIARVRLGEMVQTMKDGNFL